MDLEQIEEMVWELAFEGKNYFEIEEEILKSQGLSVLPKDVINIINDCLIDYQMASQVKEQALTQIILGVAVILIGIGIAFFPFFERRSQNLLAWGALLVGAWTLKEGYKKYKSPIGPKPKRSIFSNSKFNRK